MRLPDLPSEDEILAEELHDPAFRDGWIGPGLPARSQTVSSLSRPARTLADCSSEAARREAASSCSSRSGRGHSLHRHFRPDSRRAWGSSSTSTSRRRRSGSPRDSGNRGPHAHSVLVVADVRRPEVTSDDRSPPIRCAVDVLPPRAPLLALVLADGRVPLAFRTSTDLESRLRHTSTAQSASRVQWNWR